MGGFPSFGSCINAIIGNGLIAQGVNCVDDANALYLTAAVTGVKYFFGKYAGGGWLGGVDPASFDCNYYGYARPSACDCW